MLKARVLTALVLLAGFLAALFFLPDRGWALFAAAVAGGGAWEWAGLMRRGGRSRFLFAAGTAVAALGLGILVLDPMRRDAAVVIYLLAGLAWVTLIPLWLSRRWRLPSGGMGWLVGWIVLIPACLALIQLRQFSAVFLLLAMALVWVADIAAYFVGRAFGRRKLAPAISPGKSWEGALGGGVGVVIYGFVAAYAAGKLDGRPVGAVMVFAGVLLALTAISVIGDLFESLMKRQAGLKDSGNLLPGHGGILDRIDSLTSTLPWLGLAIAVQEWWW